MHELSKRSTGLRKNTIMHYKGFKVIDTYQGYEIRQLYQRDYFYVEGFYIVFTSVEKAKAGIDLLIENKKNCQLPVKINSFEV